MYIYVIYIGCVYIHIYDVYIHGLYSIPLPPSSSLPKWSYQTCVLWKLWLYCLKRKLKNERHWEPFPYVDNFLHGGVWLYVPYMSEYTLSLHNDPVRRVNEETEAQTCDVPQWERSSPVTQVALNPPCEAGGCFGLRPHTGLDDLWVGHSWIARARCSVDRCQSNREKTTEMTTWIMALAFNFLDYLSVGWVFSTPHPECSPRFTSRQRKAARGGAWNTDLTSSWMDAVTSASGSWDFRNARAVCLRDTSCTLAGRQLGKQLWLWVFT